MAQINNTDLLLGIRNNAKVVNAESVPSTLASTVVPVMETNPMLLRRINIVKNQASTTTGAVAIYTTPTNQDFYLSAMTLTYRADVNCDAVIYSLTGYLEGVNSNLLTIRKNTLTADSFTITLSLPYPLKLDRNTVINVNHSFTAGTSTVGATIFGYVVNP